MWSIATVVAWSVCLPASVCLFAALVNCAEMAEQTGVPIEVRTKGPKEQ